MVVRGLRPPRHDRLQPASLSPSSPETRVHLLVPVAAALRTTEVHALVVVVVIVVAGSPCSCCVVAVAWSSAARTLVAVVV